MSVITMLGGREIDVLRVRVADIDFRELGLGLAHTCRYLGQVPRFYSVAEHSLRVAQEVNRALDEAEAGGNGQDGQDGQDGGEGARRRHALTLEALVHDAAEALIGDHPRPYKHRLVWVAEERMGDGVLPDTGVQMGHVFRGTTMAGVELAAMRVIWRAAGLADLLYPSAEVCAADDAVLADEMAWREARVHTGCYGMMSAGMARERWVSEVGLAMERLRQWPGKVHVLSI